MLQEVNHARSGYWRYNSRYHNNEDQTHEDKGPTLQTTSREDKGSPLPEDMAPISEENLKDHGKENQPNHGLDPINKELKGKTSQLNSQEGKDRQNGVTQQPHLFLSIRKYKHQPQALYHSRLS